MRRLIVLSLVLIGFAAQPVTASASNGAATPFTAAYPLPMPDGGTADLTCSGVHVVNHAGAIDNETCLITGDTNGFVAGTYRGNPAGNVPPLGVMAWASDYNGVVATRFISIFVNKGNGTWTNHIISFYR